MPGVPQCAIMDTASDYAGKKHALCALYRWYEATIFSYDLEQFLCIDINKELRYTP